MHNPRTILRIRFLLEYLLLRCAGAFCRLFPRRTSLALADRIGDMACYCFPVRKQLAMQNLQQAFPEKNFADIRRIVRGVYRNFARTAVEHLRLAKMTPSDLLQIVNIEGEEHLQEALARGQGVIFAGGHFGNWEYMFMALAAAGYPHHAVVANINNRFINNIICAHRHKMGVNLLPKKGSLPEINRILKNNGIVTLLIDQDARRRGIFVDFLGRPASTSKGPAKLTLAHNATLLFVIPVRNPDHSITIKIRTINTQEHTMTESRAIQELTQLCAHVLEEYVRRFPDTKIPDGQAKRDKTNVIALTGSEAIPDISLPTPIILFFACPKEKDTLRLSLRLPSCGHKKRSRTESVRPPFV